MSDAGALRTADFDFHLPPERIAQSPLERRDASRLLVLDRARDRIEHRVFTDLADLIPPGDLLVLNETKVFPARLVGRKTTGAAAEVLLQHPEPTAAPGDDALWRALVRPGNKLRPGHVVEIGDALSVEIVDVAPDGDRVVRLRTPLPVPEALERYGAVPLPPYVQREATPADRERYQTVFARHSGSIAAPTAGLHFTPELLARLRERGVRFAQVVLHVGVGTFRPVEVEDATRHAMHREWYDVPEETAQAVREARGRAACVWAVGTTVARTLETVAEDGGLFRAGSGWTEIFIHPPYRFRVVDRLITNFHLPRSTLLMLVSAFAGRERVLRAYAEAVERGYRFYSYGDAMALL